jgi:hypothetical protein
VKSLPRAELLRIDWHQLLIEKGSKQMSPFCFPSLSRKILQRLSRAILAISILTLSAFCSSSTFIMASTPLPATPSVDSPRIAFTSARGQSSQISTVNSDGSGILLLTSGPNDNMSPSWAPDSGKIAFTSTRDGNEEIYVMDADGANPVRLTHNIALDEWPAWSPDGKK